mmetsp:Transcript_36047/g.81456  ORF Transcript_36047/g.81456 Transcript_36047/m.81456 type:complete len:237 (+) Transcript_36047:2-712(+)
MNSLITLVWTLVIVFVLLYVFAILGMELVRTDPNAGAAYNDSAQENFGDLLSAMLTLLQGLTLDSVGTVYRPLVLEKPELSLYFIAFILIVSIALMNLVTALMVESALEQASQDRAALKREEAIRRKAMIGKLQLIFERLDQDGSGQLDLEEMRGAPADVQDLLQEVAQTSDSSELLDIFYTLDYKGTSSVGVRDFCEGLMRLQDGKPLEVYCIMKQCTEMLAILRSLNGGFQGVS